MTVETIHYPTCQDESTDVSTDIMSVNVGCLRSAFLWNKAVEMTDMCLLRLNFMYCTFNSYFQSYNVFHSLKKVADEKSKILKI